MRENIPQKLRHVHIYFCGKSIGSTLHTHGQVVQRISLRTRAPQNAAIAKTRMNTNPLMRCEIVLLLHAWSTAISQTKKSAIAPPARIFISISVPLNSR